MKSMEVTSATSEAKAVMSNVTHFSEANHGGLYKDLMVLTNMLSFPLCLQSRRVRGLISKNKSRNLSPSIRKKLTLLINTIIDYWTLQSLSTINN